MSREDSQLKIRVPSHLKDVIEAAARNNHRSINAEVVARLVESFDTDRVFSNYQLLTDLTMETSEEEPTEEPERLYTQAEMVELIQSSLAEFTKITTKRARQLKAKRTKNSSSD